MSFPDLTVEQIAKALPEAKNISYLNRGGQKVVFVGEMDGVKYALKFLRPAPHSFTATDPTKAAEDVSVDDVTARAHREVETMRQCNTPHLIKPGPIGIKTVEVNGESLLFYTEEFIDGETLHEYLKRVGPLPIPDLIRLAAEVAQAVGALWAFEKIHRDIKPGNIMRRRDGSYVLLDMGFVFDLNDDSYSIGPVGTMVFFSPEQTDFANRRTILDFRSDLFSLGMTLYIMATGQHPFAINAKNSFDVMVNIQKQQPNPPQKARADLPIEFCDILVRLLAKRPSLRYRKISMLLNALAAVPMGGNK